MRLVISAGSVIGSPKGAGSSARASSVPIRRKTAATIGWNIARITVSDPDAGALLADRQIGGVAVFDLQAERGEIGRAVIGDRHELHAAVGPHEQDEAVRGAVAIVRIGVAD